TGLLSLRSGVRDPPAAPLLPRWSRPSCHAHIGTASSEPLSVPRLTHTILPESLPLVLAGPILRRLQPDRLVLWLVGSTALNLTLLSSPTKGSGRRLKLDARYCRHLRIGCHACLHFIDVPLCEPLPQDTLIHYDLIVTLDDGVESNIAQWAPHLLHKGETMPSLVLRSRSDNILYGSCRKPHQPARDGLA